MIEPDELRAELARAATVDEPPLTLDTDRVVAGGRSRRLRRQALLGAGGALAVAMVIGVPALVFTGSGPGIGVRSAGAGGPTIEPTPGAPHGGCRGQTRSGSTEAYALAQWLQANMPDGRKFATMDGWQVSYLDDCVDGSRQDSNEVSFRRRDRAGDLTVAVARNAPAERVTPPCQPDTAGASSMAVPTASPTTRGVPTGTSTTAVSTSRPAGKGGAVGMPAGTDGGRYTRCESRGLADGSTLTIEEQRNSTDRSRPPVVSLTVVLWRTDGTVVRAVGDNRVVFDSQHPTVLPSLTADQVIALVQNRSLQPFIPPAR